MRAALTVFVSWGKLQQPRFPKEEREQCAALGCACKKCSEGSTRLLFAHPVQRRGGEHPWGSMGNGAEASVLGNLGTTLRLRVALRFPRRNGV